MNEVSNVATLITRLIAFAIALGAAGTIVDEVFVVKDEARKAVVHGGISYSKWNRTLLERGSRDK